MVSRKRILLILSMMTISLFAGCGGGHTNVQNAPPPPSSSDVSITFQTAPPTSITSTSTAAFAAVVSNDPNNEGVDWTLVCTSGSPCGTLTPLHTSSGAAATFTPPPNMSGNSASANILAFATADHTKNVAATITVTVVKTALAGTFVFQNIGADANGAYQVAGVIVLNGANGISAGEQTHCDAVQCFSDLITGGSYAIGSDGRGTLTLNTANANIGQLGIENFSLVLLSKSRALLATLDDPSLQTSGETSVGAMDLQATPTKLSGGYAFTTSGTDIASGQFTAFGGILNVDSPKTISGAGSLIDQDLGGTLTNCPAPAVTGTVTDPDPFGQVTFNLSFDPNTCFVSNPTAQFVGYLVDATHIKLIETDNNGLGTGSTTAGVATSQGASTGTFTNNSAFAGNYVFGLLGEDLSFIPSSLSAAGTFTADGSGNLNNGTTDEFLAGLAFEASDSFTGTYSLDPTGSGRVDSFITLSNSSNPGAELIFYLTGNGNPPLVLYADGDVNFGALGVATGPVYPKAPAPFSFAGNYGLNFTTSSSVGTGQTSVNSSLTPPLAGIVDTNLGGSPNLNSQLTGTFGPIPNSGTFPGSLTNTFFPSNTLSGAFYLIDSGHGFFIETDTLGLFLGDFETLTPICPGCP